MAQTINTESFIKAWVGERCLWDVSSAINKNRYEEANSRKKLTEQFSVTGTVKSCFSLLCICLHTIHLFTLIL